MESKQLAVYLIMGGAVIVALKFITEIISFILSDFFLWFGSSFNGWGSCNPSIAIC